MSSRQTPPLCAVSNVTEIIPATFEAVELRLPLSVSRVCAGFPSPAEEHVEQRIDLNKELVRHPLSTFFVRVTGDSMSEAGIDEGDLLVVDKAAPVGDGHIIVAVVNGEFCVKRLRRAQGRVCLQAANPRYAALEITEGMEFEVWGRVLYIIRKA